jgi:F-type H+-transporting ATPase subunit a
MSRTASGACRNAILVSLVLIAPALFAEGGAAAGPVEKGFSLSEELFKELTDNTEAPFLRLLTFDVGRFRIELAFTKHSLLMILVTALVTAAMLYLASRLRDPYRRPSRLQSLLEMIVEYMRREVFAPVLGDEGKRFVPLCLTLFLFVLFSNLVGLIPPFVRLPAVGGHAVWVGGAITGNLAVTLGLGLIVFAVFNYQGMKAQGFVGYWKHLIPHGTPGWMAPFAWLMEFVGLLSKTLALIMRLFANMIGGHVAIMVILLLIIKFESLSVGPAAVLIDLAISGLEVIVAVLQAYIFSFLSALFIGMALQKH